MIAKKKLLKLAQKLFDDKKYTEVIALLTDDLLDKAKSAEMYTQRAWAHNRLTESELARAYVNKALNYDPQYAKAYSAMGFAFGDKTDYDKAIENYTEAIGLDPVNDVAFYNRGVSWFYKGEYDLAILDYNKAIDLNSKYINAIENRGTAWALKKEYDKAIKDFTKSIEIDSKRSRPFNNRGNVWAIKLEFEKAVLDFDVAISLDQNNAIAYRNRALMNEFELKDYEKAAADYSKAIELDKAENKDIIYHRDALLEKIRERKQLREIKTAADGISAEDLGKQLAHVVAAISELALAGKPETTVHYTGLDVADKILTGSKSDGGNQSEMRYYNAIYMKDPAEGQFIFNCFTKENKDKIQAVFDNGKVTNVTSVYLGSFLSNNKTILHEDDTAMWRKYGKDENKSEASGCSFVINESFFDKPNKLKLLDQTTDWQLRQNGALPPQGLYNIIYCDSGRYRNDENDNIKNAMLLLEDILMKLLGIQQDCEREENKRTIDSLIFNHLSRISYLFKSADYVSEHEVRVIQYMPRGTELIQADESYPPKLYIQSNKSLIPYLKKICLGPRVNNPDHWITYLNFRISQHGLENPGKIEEASIEIRKSACSLREVKRTVAMSSVHS